MASKEILGIDVGGSGIKGAVVDIETGKLTVERHRIATPQPATPEKIAKTIKEIAKHFDYKGKIGVGYPAVIKNGVIKTAANIDKSNIEINADKLFSKITGNEVYVINDADAAGIAENSFGHGKDIDGTVLFLTVGTGIGSALFINGKLVPNTEFGHLFMHNGLIAEKYTSDAARKTEDLKWSKWGMRFNKYLQHLELLLSPKLFIIGGGVSKKMEKFKNKITIDTPVKPAMLLNEAGIIGAAMNAAGY
jgi:polyphosphate glucokinase